MADGTTAKFDFSGWDKVLGRLTGPARESLARSMAVAGGQVLRDEARARVPHSEHGAVTDVGPRIPLAEAIYLAFNEGKSTSQQVEYSVSWNGRKAPHGHLVEFGHWQPYAVIWLEDGSYITDPRRKLANPKWVPAKPFLRPAYEAAGARARETMVSRGRARLPELLGGGAIGESE